LLGPFRVFDGLMSADWIADDLKREFCRGVLECTPEIERLRKNAALIKNAFDQNLGNRSALPGISPETSGDGAGGQLPMLKRHAVRALGDEVGEPLPEVIAEFFCKQYHDQKSSEAATVGVLDAVGLHAEDLGPDQVKKLARKAIKHTLGTVRHAGYRLGAKQFGPGFAAAALKDSWRPLRDWAAKLVRAKPPKTGRKTASCQSTSPEATH